MSTKVKDGNKVVAVRKRPSVGERIIEGLEQAIAWSKGEDDRARVTVVQTPLIDIRKAPAKWG